MLMLRRGVAAAICQLWSPPTSSWDIKDASYWDLLTPEGQECFDQCHDVDGEWSNACLSLFERHGPFYSLEFLACKESSQGQGLASTLLTALTTRADKEKRHMFLVAMSEKLMRWYSLRFGFVPTKQSSFRRRQSEKSTKHGTKVNGDTWVTANLFYMERPPMM